MYNIMQYRRKGNELKRYANGIITRERIIETCRMLFYENGFRAATFDLICRTAEVNPGTVAHHFTNKLNIASLIYQEMIDSLNDSVKELFAEEDQLQQVMTSLCLHIRILFSDSAYRRFSAEYLCEKAYCMEKESTDSQLPLSRNAVSVMHERMDIRKIRLYSAAYSGIGGNIETFIDRHIDEYTFEESARCYFEFHYLFLEDSELEKRINRAFFLNSLLDAASDKFKISVRLKK